ncbi:hypothetical protein LTR36_006151 [Oleoguttula mirabilis]|uniref:Aquaporin-like protein n=1 Tax=Oleoguttula mirabilis TaxID=1507867 RepID=A0AAV9JCT8_9PEZI|nr:hypothetical protein LTR36_006151 [Oleoguttula mirabilis]
MAGGRSQFTLAGPDETSKVREAHEPYVHPGYADLNPAYEQPANAKPVWSLAKPLPRVVRPGMVPTRAEIVESRVNAEVQGENNQRLGPDVDLDDLEKGRIQRTPTTKLSAQLEDSRTQREHNFLNTLQRYGTTSSRVGTGTRLSNVASLASSTRRRRASTSAARPPEVMRPTWESDEEEDEKQETMPPMSPLGEEMRPHAQEEFPRPTHRHTGLDTIPESRPVSPRPGVPDDVASLSTLAFDDEPDMLEHMAPLMQSFIQNEVHNNHTSWSLVRTANREFLAELLAVFCQLTIGFCSDIAVTVANKGNPNTTDWAWGFATMIGIYISGGISGAHLNPTITTMLWCFRGFPKSKMPGYFGAQFLGAFLAAFTAYGLYYSSIHEYLATNATSGIVDSFVTSARYTYIDAATAFFNELIATAFLVVAVLALGDDQNAPPGSGMNAFIIGLVITVLSMAFAYQTGAALNPSRDFGPRLALLALGYGGDLFTNPYWFYGPFAGTLCGAFVGGTLYDVAIFTGGESPINYPWSRTKRATRKSKKKWERRLHMAKKEEVDQDIF